MGRKKKRGRGGNKLPSITSLSRGKVAGCLVGFWRKNPTWQLCMVPSAEALRSVQGGPGGAQAQPWGPGPQMPFAGSSPGIMGPARIQAASQLPGGLPSPATCCHVPGQEAWGCPGAGTAPPPPLHCASPHRTRQMEIAAALLIYSHGPDFNGLFLLPNSYGLGLLFLTSLSVSLRSAHSRLETRACGEATLCPACCRHAPAALVSP